VREEERVLLNSIRVMADEAPAIGLCAAPFEYIYDSVVRLIAERDGLLEASRAQ
jgi:hypothetical protein